MSIREHANKAVTLCNQHPGRVNCMPPAGHQATMVSNYQRCLFAWIIGGGHKFIPGALYTVQYGMPLHQPLRIAVRTVPVFIYGHVCAFNSLGQVIPVVVIGYTC